jgi:hypothetical protein
MALTAYEHVKRQRAKKKGLFVEPLPIGKPHKLQGRLF